MFAHLEAVDHLAHFQGDLFFVLEPAFAHAALKCVEPGFGGLKQFLALSAPLGTDQRVAAQHQPLCGPPGIDDLGQVSLVKERELDQPLLAELADLTGF